MCTVYFTYITSDVFPYGDETNEDEAGSYIIVGYYQQQIFFGEFYIFLPPEDPKIAAVRCAKVELSAVKLFGHKVWEDIPI